MISCSARWGLAQQSTVLLRVYTDRVDDAELRRHWRDALINASARGYNGWLIDVLVMADPVSSCASRRSGCVGIPGRNTGHRLDRAEPGIARVAIDRPRNAMPSARTVAELCDAFARIRDDSSIGVVLLTGVGPADDGGYAFCAGGDQSVRGDGGYLDEQGLPRLNVLDLQRLIHLPKVVIALVAGYAIGGGQVLHLLCDLSLAADNAVFGQTGPRVGSFDGGFGAGYLARVVGQRKARDLVSLPPLRR